MKLDRRNSRQLEISAEAVRQKCKHTTRIYSVGMFKLSRIGSSIGRSGKIREEASGSYWKSATRFPVLNTGRL